MFLYLFRVHGLFLCLYVSPPCKPQLTLNADDPPDPVAQGFCPHFQPILNTMKHSPKVGFIDNYNMPSRMIKAVLFAPPS